MKTLMRVTAVFVLTGLVMFCAVANAAIYQMPPTNPPPVVQLAWNQSAGATNYTLYYGVASGQYTNRTMLGNVTNVVVTLAAFGVQYFFAVSETEGGLESATGNEVSYTTPAPGPAPTGMQVPTLLQARIVLEEALWADTGMQWGIEEATATNGVYRLNVSLGGL
jgi:hypothetical protein